MIKKISQNEHMNIQSAIQCKGGEGGGVVVSGSSAIYGILQKTIFVMLHTHTHTCT